MDTASLRIRRAYSSMETPCPLPAKGSVTRDGNRPAQYGAGTLQVHREVSLMCARVRFCAPVCCSGFQAATVTSPETRAFYARCSRCRHPVGYTAGTVRNPPSVRFCAQHTEVDVLGERTAVRVSARLCTWVHGRYSVVGGFLVVVSGEFGPYDWVGKWCGGEAKRWDAQRRSACMLSKQGGTATIRTVPAVRDGDTSGVNRAEWRGSPAPR